MKVICIFRAGFALLIPSRERIVKYFEIYEVTMTSTLLQTSPGIDML
jgi:hypothetical protein